MDRSDAPFRKRFEKNDSGFVCAACGADVPPLGYSSRNHCPRCLCSLHVDVLPGDRGADCGGIMRPVSALADAKRGFIIIHRCDRCGELRRCAAADDDNRALLVVLTSRGQEFAAAAQPAQPKKSAYPRKKSPRGRGGEMIP